MAHHHRHHHHHNRKTPKSQTLPSSPTHSSSSSDFEFTISTTNLCPADDLFYKGQLLPLHLSPRISMVRTLLLSSSSTSSSATTTARHSSDSFSTDSSRPSSVADDDLHLNLNHNLNLKLFPSNTSQIHHKKPNKYFSLSRFSSVFRKETKPPTARVDPDVVTGSSSVKRMSVTAKEVIRKYLKKAKPLYEKLSQRHGLQAYKGAPPAPAAKTDEISDLRQSRKEKDVVSHSFSGNLRYPRRRSCVSSCPSSMRSSPSHSGILCRNSVLRGTGNGTGIYSGNSSSMEELQSAIQGAIAHCKNSMTQN